MCVAYIYEGGPKRNQKFASYEMTVDNKSCYGRQSMSRTSKIVAKIRALVLGDLCCTIDELKMLYGIPRGSIQRILNKDLTMRVAAKAMP